MKSVLSLFSVATLIMGATLHAETIEVPYESTSAFYSDVIAASGILTDTETGNQLSFNTESSFFNLSHGVKYKIETLQIESIPTEADSLVLDFTWETFPTVDIGLYLTKGATVPEEYGGYTPDYLLIDFIGEKSPNFATLYQESPITIIGKFKNDVEAVGYIISETCDMDDVETTYGGIVFFNESVTVPKPIPEPTTTTLSLLALAGMAARRRRR